ncbi:MAG TPA: hypothetical protein VI455_02175 [Terriglobia bacterium]
MATVLSPYGLRVYKMLGDTPYSGGQHTLALFANQTTGLFFGDPVGLINGNPVALTASPTTTLSANSPIGVFMGCSYQDPVRGFVNSQYLPANLISGGATQVTVKVMDSPFLVMAVQANGPVQANQIGLNASLTNFGFGSTQTGDSQVQLVAGSVATTATLAVRIYDFVYHAAPSPGASSQPGDAYTDVLVVWNFGVQRYMNSAAQ